MRKIFCMILAALLASGISGCGAANVIYFADRVTGNADGDVVRAAGTAERAVQEPAEIPVFYTDSLQNLNAQKDAESSYITDLRLSGGEHFEIDENGVLLGNNLPGTQDILSDPVEIAPDAIHVDASANGYFVIWITKDHDLYGEGLNLNGILGQPVPELLEGEIRNIWNDRVSEPVLLMQHVKYASAGRESLCALTDGGDVYWWGTLVSCGGAGSVMESSAPELMMQGCRYTVCGTSNAAAIDEKGDLWIWGDNTLGQCGDPGPEESAVTSPHGAASDVEMAWTGILSSKKNSFTDEDIEDYVNLTTVCTYIEDVFLRKTDGTYMACGGGLPGKTGTVHIAETGENRQEEYSDEFLEIEVKER